MFIITMIGTAKSIPITHHRLHQNANAIIITSGLRLSLFHINLGSTIFHIKTWIQTSQDVIITTAVYQSNCISDKSAGNITAIIDQTLGIKFNININIAQKIAKSNQNEVIII